MAETGVEALDSQILAEHVGFLDNCFDNSFVLQSSLLAVKKYVTEELGDYVEKNTEHIPSKKKNSFKLDKTVVLDTSVSKIRPSQVSTNQKTVSKNLKHWGLPEEIARKYEQRGITEMFDWQVNCLANSKILLDSCNLVYSAPTSAGKTLVAEILTIKTIYERQKKVIVILPFVSIVREKMFYLQDILSSSGIRVEGFMGSKSPPGGLQAVHVAICTIEKANSLINKLLNDGDISELGAVIVDELHLLGDPHRGYILELLLTKIKYVTLRSDNVTIQIVGMSATLPNLEVLANWLDAELFVTQFRPIPLDELCLVKNKLYNKDGMCVSTLKIPTTNESDSVLNICLETIKESCSVLIFCMTKNRCESLAQTIASQFYNLGHQQCDFGSVLRNQLKTDSITEVLEQLQNCPVGLDKVLKQTLSFGVAYHHAGLTFDERDIIEGGFKSGAIRVLVATSTLSSGVNLPARKVIIRTPVFMRQPINILTYKQMIGRAGRMGKDTKGESILICTENEKKIGFELMIGALDPVKSCIETADKYMRAVLEMIASQVLCTKSDIDLYSKCTLLFTQQELSSSQNKLLNNTLEELKNYELVRVQNNAEDVQYVATPLGKACLSASMAPNDGLSLFLELQKARQCLVLETDLHLIYLVTPYSVSSQWGDLDWLHLLTLWESLTKAMKRVGDLVGVRESFIIHCMRGKNKSTNEKIVDVHKRFYTALALQDLVNEVPLSEVAIKFQCARGFLQSLQQAAATFAGMVTAFCRQLGWKNMEILISQFQDRLHFGIHSELLELMKLPSLNCVRARSLFDSGFETVTSIAAADINVIENILHKAVPFQSEKEREDDDKHDMKKRNKIKSIWITGCCGMTPKEAAQNLIMEARKHLENEIGVTEIKWSTNVANITKPHEDAINSKDTTPEDNSIHRTILIDKMDQDLTKSCKNDIKFEEDCMNIKPDRKEMNKSRYKSSKMSLDLLDISSEDVYISANSCNQKVKEDQTLLNKEQISSQVYDIFQETILIDESTKKGEIACQNNSTPITDNTPKLISNVPTDKNDIVWDSLNFTEDALGNITKLRTSIKYFSPNISFGESDKSAASENLTTEDQIKNVVTDAASNSNKDISLFSTDGDDSSIFEESLPLDLIPSRLLDNKNTFAASAKPETTADFASINSNSILNAFASPLNETEEYVDIKLVFDEEDENNHQSCLNLSKDNEVACSQDIRTMNEFKSPSCKRPCKYNSEEHQAKKKKIDELTIDHGLKNSMAGKSKTIFLNENYRLNCAFEYEDVCRILSGLKQNTKVSVCLKFKPIYLVKTKIGSDILNIPKKQTKDDSFLGMALSLGNDCVFLDRKALDTAKDVIKSLFESNTHINMYLLKKQYLQLKELGFELPSISYDVCIVDWLINNAEVTQSIEFLIQKYCGINLSKANIKIDGQRKAYADVDLYAELCIRARCISMIAEKQASTLIINFEITKNTVDTEHHVAAILARSEYHGITVDRVLASQMLAGVKHSQDMLQKKANKLAGCRVDMNSPKCIAKVLGFRNQGKTSTKKTVLTCHNSPLSSIVIYWRKLNCILTKTLYPLTEKAYNYKEENKLKPTYTMHTNTGRISMCEPNLQNVPRTFSIPYENLEMNDLDHLGQIEFNCRNIFKASEGYVLVSADYCQLEMRVLTHFSEDAVLLRIMKSGVDVFKSIAASWSNVPEYEVDDDLRQKAKQLCYGILYGMGNKTLGLHLDVTELEAAFFMDSFYNTFPRVKEYKQNVIEECKKKTYVLTLMKRKRHLPNIISRNAAARSAAERQAVNTTIQGSAADIAKAAMCAIDDRTNSLEYKPRLILQMHDELIYEVPEENKIHFTRILKELMEITVKLKVPLPVKVKSGHSWGSLEDVKL